MGGYAGPCYGEAAKLGAKRVIRVWVTVPSPMPALAASPQFIQALGPRSMESAIQRLKAVQQSKLKNWFPHLPAATQTSQV
jgi:hypothetical protein